MRENIKLKTLSIIVAIFMIASAIVVFNMVEKVEASRGSNITGSITSISPSGQGVSGAVNISWTNSSLSASAVNGTHQIKYNVTFSRSPTSGWKDDGTGNLSAGGGSLTYYIWNTTTNNIADGVWYVNVTATAFNSSSDQKEWVDGTSVRVTVRNSLSGTPGVNQFQGGKHYTTRNITTNQVLSTASIDYEVGNSYTISVNSACEWGTSTYYLFYPVYKGSDVLANSAYSVEWHRYPAAYSINPSTGDYSFGTISFTGNYSRAGIWVIDTDTSHIGTADFSTAAQYNSTVPAWFWVNTSTDYTMADLPDSFAYNSTGALTISLTDEDGEQSVDDTIVPVVDIRRDSNGSSIKGANQLANTWTYSNYYKNNSYTGNEFPGLQGFWSAGNYTAMAYIDIDTFESTGYSGVQYYTEYATDSSTRGDQHYNLTYGSNSAKDGSASWLSSASTYNYTLCGPWDPPEHNVTQQRIRVTTATPYSYVHTANATMYYGFPGIVNITFKEKESQPRYLYEASHMNVTIWDDDNDDVTEKFSNDGSNGCTYAANISNGWFTIYMDTWGYEGTDTFGNNGTWKAKIYLDVNGDRTLASKEYTEEYNITVTWRVRKAPTAQFKWIDDDGDLFTDDDLDGVIPYVPPPANIPLDVEFKVLDQVGVAFGETSTGKESGICLSVLECAENITITGDSLFTGRLCDFPGYGLSATACGYSGGVWSVPIIPTMSLGGGSIKITVSCYNTTVSETISIGGSNYWLNGSIVEIEGGKDTFQIDSENHTITVTVKNSETGELNPYGSIHIYYLDDGTITAANTLVPIKSFPITNATATGTTYTFWFNQTQQTTNQTRAGFSAAKAPRNLTVFFDGPGTDQRNGYALIQMTPVNDLEVHLSQNVIMAGYEYDDFRISVDKAGNSTDVPSKNTADKQGFFVKIVDEDGEDVTGTSNTDALLNNFYNTYMTYPHVPDTYILEQDGVYGLTSGIYTVYAWNNTHSSEGHNATLEIRPVTVSCDKQPFVWKADNNISAIFTMLYNGTAVNCSLVIDNMTDTGKYNKTWTNCSFNGNSDAAGNASLDVDSTLIINGVVKIDDITANAMHPNLAEQHITFWVRPVHDDGSDGQYAKAKFDDGTGVLKNYMNVEVPSITPDPVYIPLGRTTKVYTTVTGRGATLPDIYVRLHGCGFDKNSTSDIDGRVQFSVTPSTTGNISIDVGEEGRTLEDIVVYVTAWVLDVDTNKVEVNEGETFTVTVMKEGTTEYVEGATITVSGIGTATTDANGEATLTAPSVTSDRTLSIIVEKEGYAPEPNTPTITVINIPKLTITLSGDQNAEGCYISPVTIAISNDVGDLITGATVTITDPDGGTTTKTTVNGQVEYTAPTTGTYTITATFTGFEAAATMSVCLTGTPGFELLTLIVALGIAFILLRRRRK